MANWFGHKGIAVGLALLAACTAAPEPGVKAPATQAADALPATDSAARTSGLADAAPAAGGAAKADVTADTAPETAAAVEVAAASPEDATAATDSQGPPDTTVNAETAQGDATAQAAGPTAGICFAGPPGAATDTGALPMPDPQWSCPQLATPEWFAGQVAPAPTLAVQIGFRDGGGSWQPLADGDWVPLATMMQGGFHLELVPLVTVAGKTEVKLQFQVDAFAVSGCAVVASTPLAKTWLVQAPGPDPIYTTDPTAKTFVVFGDSATKIKASCGIWLQVVWRLRLLGTPQWGQVVRTLRTYDGSGLAGGVPTKP